MAGIAAALGAAGNTGADLAAPPIAPAPRAGDLPLSFAQQRLWFLDQLAPGQSLYHIAGAVRLAGRLQAGALRAALSAIAGRHESLRTGFQAVEGRPLQVIVPGIGPDLPLVDL